MPLGTAKQWQQHMVCKLRCVLLSEPPFIHVVRETHKAKRVALSCVINLFGLMFELLECFPLVCRILLPVNTLEIGSSLIGMLHYTETASQDRDSIVHWNITHKIGLVHHWLPASRDPEVDLGLAQEWQLLFDNLVVLVRLLCNTLAITYESMYHLFCSLIGLYLKCGMLRNLVLLPVCRNHCKFCKHTA